MDEPLAEDELTEIFVRCDEQGTTGIRFAEDFRVPDARRKLGDVEHIVSVGAKALHDRPVNIFISDDVHAVFVLIG